MKSAPLSLILSIITFWNDMASAVTTHPDTSSLSNSRGTDLISLLFTSVAKVKSERSEYADAISGLRPLSYKDEYIFKFVFEVSPACSAVFRD